MPPIHTSAADQPASSTDPDRVQGAPPSVNASVGAALGLLWALCVLTLYLVHNHQYFIQKVATFGRFLLSGGA